MPNISEKINKARELISQSRLFALMPEKQAQMLAKLDQFSAEATPEDEELIDIYINVLNLEQDSEIAEGVQSMRMLKQFLSGAIELEGQVRKTIILIRQEEKRRLNEMKNRLEKDSNTDISDLLIPIKIS